MQQGITVSHLVAKVMHAGVPGGNENMRPVVWNRRGGGFTFELVRGDLVSEVLGRVETPYYDQVELTREITEAHVKWGFPTPRMLELAFPSGRFTK